MIQLPFANGKNYAVLGLGKSGKAAVASLLASGAKVMAWDDKDSTRAAMQKEFPTLVMKPVAEWNAPGLASLVMSPGIFLTHPAVIAARKADVEVIADIELLFRAQPDATYVGITGTNGKGTVAAMVTSLLVAHGLSVGTYTSPHLERVHERICLDSEPISDDDLAEAIWGLVADRAAGVVHLAGPERLSRAQIGLRCAEHLGLSADLVRTASAADHPQPRPRDLSLASVCRPNSVGGPVGW